MTGYRYLYSGNFSNVTPRYWLGGMHSCSCFLTASLRGCAWQTHANEETADIPLVFGTHYEYRGNSTEFEWQTSFAMECKPRVTPINPLTGRPRQLEDNTARWRVSELTSPL
jgi:hypothetical protein